MSLTVKKKLWQTGTHKLDMALNDLMDPAPQSSSFKIKIRIMAAVYVNERENSFVEIMKICGTFVSKKRNF